MSSVLSARWVGVVSFTAFGVLAACSSASAPNSGPAGSHGPNGAAPASTMTIKLIQSPWDASRINVAIARILLTEKLGMSAEVVDVDEYKQWDRIASGESHVSLEVWPSGHIDDIKNYIDVGKVENGGPLGPVGKISWYVPTYLLTEHPELASWQAYKDTAVTDLFRTPETGAKGRFLAGDPSWTQYDGDIISNLHLNLAVVSAGSEQAELAELDSVYHQRGALLLYLWVPHSALAKYDLTPVELPAYSDDCYAKAQSGGVSCDYPADHLFKILWPGLKDANPKAYAFLKSFTYTTKDQIQLLSKVDNDKLSIDQAARDWISANANVWESWIGEP